MRQWINFKAAEGEGDAARHRVRQVRWFLQRVSPIRLVDSQPLRTTPILDIGIKSDSALDRSVVLAHRLQKPGGIYVFHARDQFFQGVRLHLGGAARFVFLVQQVRHLRIEHMPRITSRLLQHNAPVLGVGVISKVRTLIDEALTLGVNHQAERIAVAAERSARVEHTEIRRIALP